MTKEINLTSEIVKASSPSLARKTNLGRIIGYALGKSHASNGVVDGQNILIGVDLEGLNDRQKEQTLADLRKILVQDLARNDINELKNAGYVLFLRSSITGDGEFSEKYGHFSLVLDQESYMKLAKVSQYSPPTNSLKCNFPLIS